MDTAIRSKAAMSIRDKIPGSHLPSNTIRLVLASLFPLLAFALQWQFWSDIQPYAWLLFYPAVFFSSWLGGKWAGFLATVTSTIVVWWVFIPPRYAFTLERPSSAVAMVIFAFMGALFSLTHDRLRKANRQAAGALASANAMRDHLEERIAERTADLARNIDALGESEAKYRLTLESMLEGCQIIGFDWRYRYLNESAEQHNRRPNAELLGRTVMECWPGFTETRVFALEKSCMEDRTTQKLETEFIFPDGQRGWYRVIIQPAPEGIVVFSEEISERKRAELELKEQETMLRMVLETIPVGVWIVDAKGTIIHGNQAGQRIWAGALYVGMEQYDQYKGWWADSGERIRSWEWAAARAVTRGETSLDEEIEIESFDGARKSVLHSAAPLLDGDRHITGAVVVIQDITERKLAEAALAESERAFRAIFEQAAVGMARLATDGGFSQVNQRLCEIVGYTREELLAMSLQEITHTDDLDADLGYKQAMLAGDLETSSLEKRYLRKDGSTVWINLTVGLVRDAAGAPDYFISVVEDISKRKQAESALRDSEARFRRMFDQAPIGAAMVSLDYRFLMVNEALCRITGYSVEELISKTFVDITHPDDIDDDLAQAWRLKTGEIDLYDMDKRYLRADGSAVWVHLNSRLIRDAEGQPLYFLPTFEDITERKCVETDLLEKQRQLEELNMNLEQRVADAVSDSRGKDRILMLQGRQAAMGEMIGNIAHQWRQPLNTLGLIVQELPMIYAHGEFSKESLEASVKKAMGVITHMSKTIEDFRNYFRPDKEKILFNVNQAVANTLLLIEPSLKGLEITVEIIQKDNVEINGYAQEYSQVLLNILLNCRDAFEEVAADRQRMITITVATENGKSVVAVADNAGGIPENIIDKVFDPYFTTKAPDKGTGIGLYMAKTIIEKNMGGRLAVRNTDDGAEFRIEV
jgi:PAS domain S-box-containing protein